MASSLILHKRITTTVAKAKALRKYVEPLITKSKTDTTQSRRTVFSYLQDKETSRILFDDVAAKVADRPGGYTRIIKLGNRLGDNAEMCMLELVDYNEIYAPSEDKTAKKSRRSRRGGKKAKATDETAETKETKAAATEDNTKAAKTEDEPKPAKEETSEDADTDTDDSKAADQ